MLYGGSSQHHFLHSMAKPIPVVGALCSVPMHCRQLHVPGTIEDRRRIDWLGKSRVSTELYGDMSDRVQLDSRVGYSICHRQDGGL